MDKLEKVNDIFGIALRLKEVDPCYELYLNRESRRFEVYKNRYGKLELQFVCPYDKVDQRLLAFARQTRIERAPEIFREIEEHNEKIEKEKVEEVLSKPKSKLESVISYLKKR